LKFEINHLANSMSSISFWKGWTPSYRKLWFAASGIFLFSLLFMWFSYFQGAGGVIQWEKIQEQKIIETTVHSFRLGPFSLTVPGESYVIFEYLQGGVLQHNTTASYIFLAILMFSAMVLLSAITTFGRFWYFGGMSLFILFVVSLRLDALRIFGMSGIAVPTAILVVFLAVSFYFKSFSPHTSFISRLLIFLSLTAITGLIIFFFAAVNFPLLQLAVVAYIPALILSILFIIMVSHEILASFVYITSQGTSKSLRHFAIISLIYMVNVLVTCLHEMGTIQWDFIYLNLYLLISLSAILGLWGFKLREPLYENIFPFSPTGAFFFIALGSICFITIGQLLGNDNDAALKVVRDLIIFTHAGFGIIFLMYIFSNFMVMMAQRLPVYKILYKPTRMPYFTFRFAGIIVTLAFVLVSYWRDYVFHSTAGFYNYVADLYMMEGNETLGKAFYEKSRTHAFRNRRASYALAMINAAHLDFEESHRNFERANSIGATDFSLVNNGNLHLWRKQYFPAIETFRQAEKIRTSAPLSNNLGFTYAQVHNLDSGVHYMSEARKHNLTKASAEANFFALTASEYLPVKADSILKSFNTTSPAVVGNAMAAATLFGQDFSFGGEHLLDNRELDLYTATLLNNYLIRNARVLDTAFTRRVDSVATDPVNFTFSEALKASLAYAYYHQGNVYRAQAILGELAYLTQSYRGKYNYIMGLWALEQGSPEIAHTAFSYAVEADYKQGRLYDAIALTEAGHLQEALVAWDTVLHGDEEAERAIAASMKQVLTLTPAQALTMNDAQKYQYTRYILTADDTTFFSKLSNTFDNANYKAQALLDMSRKQFDAGRIVPAIRFFNQTSGLELTDKKLYDDIRHFELRMLASRAEVRSLANQVNKGITFDNSRLLEKMLYTALISEFSGDLKTAEKNYEILGTRNPYFEDGILAAAAFFRKQDASGPKAYNILAEAIQINATSVRLLKAYAEEATRQGLDEYAASATQRLADLEQNRR
jgi:hypothetical protein